ncbi:MAG: toll/interleukin-1 receptor domain-containing protein [Lachnospiraceae bacterium]|nr:toll/interleukin-1 receptor domain-containing protein [Lachnospiraceae bacterium]
MAELPVKPYEGFEPYIFISYSHRDSERVFPILKHLASKGYRLWYDEGIDPGSEWPEAIASHLAKCYICIAFISRNSLNSQNCRREINFALNPEKKLNFLSVMLEEAEMTPGMELQLSTYQSILKYKYPSEEYFYEKLDHVEQIQPCNINYVMPAPAPVPASGTSALGHTGYPVSASGSENREAPSPKAPETVEKPKTESKKKAFPKFLYAVIPAALAVVLAAILIPVLITNSKRNHPDDGQTTTTERPDESRETESSNPSESGSGSESETEPVVIELSDNLYDYTFRLDEVYQLPCAFSAIEKNGWQISTSGTSGETQLEAGANQVIQVVKNGVIITIDVVNPGSSPLAIKDCMVGGIEVRQSVLPEEGSFCVAKEITPFSSIEEVLDALGPVAELNTSTYYTSLNYGTSSKHCTLFRFDHNEARYNTITVKNYPEAPRKAVSELSDDLDDLSFLLDGTLYQLPFDFGKLTENGWTIATQGMSDKTLVKGYYYETFHMSKNGATISVKASNTSGNLRPVGECLISYISVDMKGIQDPSLFQVSKGITVSSTRKEISKAFGDASNLNEYDKYAVLTYGDSYEEYTRFYVYESDTKYNNIQVTCDTNRLAEFTMTVLEAPSYLSDYKAPAELGDNLISGAIRFDGNLYQLPAPLKVFLDNGWTVVSKPAFIAALNLDAVRIEKDGVSVSLSVTNFGENQTLPENCAVTTINVSSEDGVEIELPRGIVFGTKESVVKDLGIEFNVSDGSKQTSYSLYESAKNSDLTIKVLKDTGEVNSIVLRKNQWDY